MTIDLGISFDQAEKDSRPQPIADGTYEFIIHRIDEISSRDNRPGWRWYLTIINRPDIVNRSLIYNTYFPWTPPGSTEKDASGLGMLVTILDGIGAKWNGTILPEKETFYGKTGVMKVGQRIRKMNPADPDEEGVPENTVRIVTKRRGGATLA